MDYTQEQIEAKLNSLPKDLRDAIASVEIGALVASIGDEEGLMLDQAADLMDEVGYVMLGLTRTSDFVRTLVRKLEIKESKASMIATKINDKIFNKIRASLESIQEKEQTETKIVEQAIVTPRVSPNVLETQPPITPPAPTISTSPIEKAGSFVVEKRPPSSTPLYDSSTLKREDVLRDLEDIEKLKPQNAENFVGHLIGNPTPEPVPVPIPKPVPPIPPVLPTPPVPAPEKPKVDPYREAV
jgi:hypothetical protein